jgi:hypothetical protein
MSVIPDNSATGSGGAMLAVLDPLAPSHAAVHAPAARFTGSLAGATVAFIDNSKPNFSLLADDLEQLLLSRHGVARVLRHRKPNASIGADPSVLDRMASESMVVISGSGD